MKEDIERHVRLGQSAGEYLSNDSAEKPAELNEWLNESETHQKLFDEMASEHFIRESQKFYNSVHPETEYQLFKQKKQKHNLRRILAFSTSAAAITLIGIGVWFFLKEQPVQPLVQQVALQQEIRPGSPKAILITDHDEKINLGEQQENITNNGNIVANSTNSQLNYQNIQHSGNQQQVPNHRLIVPTGGEYQLILADGTKVWMNAGSELSYPIAFNGNKREIYLQGEAYFEVAHNKNQPFYVHTGHLDICVTGTSFNISAYPEEAENHITLVEGSVNVLKEEKIIASLLPGKQLDYNHSSEKFQITDADIESVIAWKNGLFLFKEEPLSSIVNKLKRWYNVDFKFSTPAEEKRYSGNIRRDMPIDSTLNILRLTNEIDFKIGKNNEIEITAIQ